jgi:AMP-binding enzyme C-terminal domain
MTRIPEPLCRRKRLRRRVAEGVPPALDPNWTRYGTWGRRWERKFDEGAAGERLPIDLGLHTAGGGPREIEEVLHEHPAAAEAPVISIPHPVLGEEVAAAVALKPDGDVTTDELRDFAKRQVAPYKYPRDL